MTLSLKQLRQRIDWGIARAGNLIVEGQAVRTGGADLRHAIRPELA